ncbi:MAG: hypothetical protein DRR19_26140 [Candidatus Parabeggiatoa sp. nov. 1]|nr:MAG: hypothetical protein DRR19_26140 [Gammaproteobacteria bacterium]
MKSVQNKKIKVKFECLLRNEWLLFASTLERSPFPNTAKGDHDTKRYPIVNPENDAPEHDFI